LPLNTTTDAATTSNRQCKFDIGTEVELLVMRGALAMMDHDVFSLLGVQTNNFRRRKR